MVTTPKHHETSSVTPSDQKDKDEAHIHNTLTFGAAYNVDIREHSERRGHPEPYKHIDHVEHDIVSQLQRTVVLTVIVNVSRPPWRNKILCFAGR